MNRPTEQIIHSLEKGLEGSRMLRRKYKLWEETHGCCIYCGREITAEDFVYGAHSDIEHIIPQAMGGPSTLDNLACSCRECNHAKGDLTAMDFMLTRVPAEVAGYLRRLRSLATEGLISSIKYRRLTTPFAAL
ncbi:MAG: HNH endonuclease [Bacteroidales bacterium]|nr:HNH endonuclease [Bacteroidales bacterium]MCD8393549.1 HNH endonuclease [Bacteroidales bacterium]